MAPAHLVLGGARSGKSRYALGLCSAEEFVVFVATAESRDADMAARIARHRAERPARWLTVEEPLRLVARLAELVPPERHVLVDCLTLWVANRIADGASDADVLGDAEQLARLLAVTSVTSRAGRGGSVTLVSNDVGGGVHPETALGRRFQELLGRVNQVVAAACERVTLMVAGLPLALKTVSSATSRAESVHGAAR